ncbi:Putative SOS response-associated peptidase YedK [Methylobacterium sp. ap11]|nr:Putative SOS response-associated peptidase YedK [Methylobacterium sp. ap11]
MPGIFPDQMAPVVYSADGARVLTMMRWGFPPLLKVGTQPVTNVRNVASPYWRPWLKPAHRCLVPVTPFSEYDDAKPRKTPVWFALDERRPLFAFARIWRPWTGVPGLKRVEPVEEEHWLFSFLATEANGVVGPVHPKAMPGLLTCAEEQRSWLEAPAEETAAVAAARPGRVDGRVGAGRAE